MHILKALGCGVPLNIVVRDKTIERLNGTCFRGPDVHKAGNFFRWHTMMSLLRDSFVSVEFINELTYRWKQGRLGSYSVTLMHPEFVGWESTDILGLYLESELEEFAPNHHSNVLRVRSRVDRFSPRTREITLVYELKKEGTYATAVVYSVYPGKDIGKLDGDITEREGRVFFDWNHPGA